jgi:hypothetical protein
MPDSKDTRRRREQALERSAATHARAWPMRRGLPGTTLALVAIVLLAVALLWWSQGIAAWPSAMVATVLGAAAMLLVWRATREAQADSQALAEFSQHLQVGDVSGALRAVRVDTSMPAVTVPLQARPSRFDRAALEVERTLGVRERRWQARMRLSADWHWETDAELRFSWVSSDLASLVKLGVQPSDLVGHRVDAVALFEPPEEGWPALIERMRRHQPLRDVMVEVRRPGRVTLWVALNGRAYRDEDGRFAGYEGVGRDITEQRLAYLRLAESERRHAMMADLSVDWYWQTDAEHRIEQFGPMAHELLGVRAAEALGQTRWALHPDGVSEAEWTAHRADLDARRPFRNFEYAIRQGGRGRRWIAIGGQPRFDSRGEFIGYHGVGRDITLRKRAERVLLNRNQALERVVAERTAALEQSNLDLEAFARQLAHELRTPIGQIAGLADLIKSKAWDRLAEDEREWLRLQGQAARDMSGTVTALLELARSTSAPLLLEPVDLTALALSVVDDLPWTERKAAVEWEIEPGLAAHCSAALARVVLMNLLGNAAKFTRDVVRPRIAFGRDRAGDEGGFMVQDNGAGFDAERAATLFQPFVRLHRSDQFQGTGLGLSIVRRIFERHGGAISASGEPGQGAVFRFRFGPLRAAPATGPDSLLLEASGVMS